MEPTSFNFSSNHFDIQATISTIQNESNKDVLTLISKLFQELDAQIKTLKFENESLNKKLVESISENDSLKRKMDKIQTQATDSLQGFDHSYKSHTYEVTAIPGSYRSTLKTSNPSLR